MSIPSGSGGGWGREDALTVEKIYCYAGQVNEVCKLCRRLFVMAPCQACSSMEQIPSSGSPVFFFVQYHERPVPHDFWLHLRVAKAIIVCVALDSNDAGRIVDAAERRRECDLPSPESLGI